jgi:tRNA (cmo5U34)-methyltransferase
MTEDPMIHDFKFDQSVADVFDDMLERSIPFYAELQRMTAELARRFAQPGTAIVDLGCSTANTLLTLAGEIPDPSIRLVGIDSSRPMLDKARAKLEAAGVLGRCDLREADLDGDFKLDAASVVVMNWTLQFVRPLRRDGVVRKIHDNLVDGGCLIVLEKVLGEESLLNRLYIDLYYDFKKRNRYSETEIARKRESLENVLIPYRVEENVEMLARNGFAIHDVFFRWYHWAGFLGVKLEGRRR